MHGERPRYPAIPRRGVLRALALAPAALAGCAAARVERAGPLPAATALAGTPAAADAAVAAVRAVRLPADAEPAFTFRAVLTRPGEPR